VLHPLRVSIIAAYHPDAVLVQAVGVEVIAASPELLVTIVTVRPVRQAVAMRSGDSVG